MSKIHTTEPDPEAQSILHAWRKLFENNYSSELDRSSIYEEEVFGFEVSWELLKNTPLHSIFPNNPKKALELGNQVIREQFQNRNSITRPVIRIVGFDKDFSYFLEKIPGAFAWIGNGNTAPLHNPRYDFNDNILTIGSSYLSSLAEESLNGS